MFGRRITAPGIRRISERLSLSAVLLVFIVQYEPYTLELVPNYPPPLFLKFLTLCCTRMMSTRILGHNLELLRSVWFLFQRYLALISLRFGVHSLCSVLLVRSPNLVLHRSSW